ncbi:MAG TPA: AEC family transporter, partial [Solirubrobacterales bacterium]|nr:AEC family transporter [Solirubrobacterales bacterium]
MAAIVATILVATAVGVWAEERYGGRAGIAARRGLIFVLYFVLPPVTFFNLARADIDVNAGAGVALAYVALGAVTFTAWFVAARVLRLERPATGSVMCCALIANTGYLGYPLVAALLGFDALSEAVVYDVLVSAPALLLGAFSVGAAFGEAAGEGVRERTAAFFTRNPPLYAALLAVIAPDSLAPDVLVDASRIAIVAVLPLGFFAVGAALAEEADEGAIAVPPPLDAPVAAAVAIRLVLAPVLLYLIALPLIELPDTYLLLAAMPCGINTMIVTHA